MALLVTVSAAGCNPFGANVDVEMLPGEYISEDSSVLVLSPDGTFDAKGLPLSVLEGPNAAGRADASGRWEYLEKPGFIYVSVDQVSDPEVKTAGVQLYVENSDSLYFLTDPEKQLRVEFDRSK